MTTRRHTPEQVAEILVGIRTQEDTIAEIYAHDSDAELLDFVLTIAKAARDIIPTTESPEPTAREVLKFLLAGNIPINPFTGTLSRIHWAMAFREISARIGSTASAQDAYRMTVDSIDIPPNTIPEGMSEADFRAAANTALQNLIAKPDSSDHQDGSTE